MAVKSTLCVNSSGSSRLVSTIKNHSVLFAAVITIGIIALSVAIACAVVFGINSNSVKTSVTTPVVTTSAMTTTTAATTHPTPLRGPAIDIDINARWIQNGITVAGGHGYGTEPNQLYYPRGLYVDDDQTIYIADHTNYRIVEWKFGATSGQVAAGGNGYGNQTDQLTGPLDVIVDKERDSLIICDSNNRRVVKSSRRVGVSGQIIISDIDCEGLTMDDRGFLYVSDWNKNEVRRWQIGETFGTVVAGGNGEGDRLDQLSYPTYIFVDRNYSVYVSDSNNFRVIKWVEGAKEGIVVAGGQGQGSNVTQLSNPQGVVVDQLDTIYVADYYNHRIMRWPKGASHGSIIIGGNGQGEQANQLYRPVGLSFDRQGHLYVVDYLNYRVQKFQIDSSNSSSYLL